MLTVLTCVHERYDAVGTENSKKMVKVERDAYRNSMSHKLCGRHRSLQRIPIQVVARISMLRSQGDLLCIQLS